MRRREILAGLTGAAASLLPARAQQRIPVIGFLSSASADQDAGRLRGFRQGLSDMGYVEGRNVAIEYRWAEERTDRLPALASMTRKPRSLLPHEGPRFPGRYKAS